jgi:hypothetical protein
MDGATEQGINVQTHGLHLVMQVLLDEYNMHNEDIILCCITLF